MRLSPCLVILAAISACTQFPELDDAVSEQAQAAPYPALVDLGPLVTEARASRTDPAEVETSVDARVAALRARAARLRGEVVDAETRRRMQAGAG
ncbi:MAG: hypothetical protein AAFR10_13510 [Pseudomonadota bacterium]